MTKADKIFDDAFQRTVKLGNKIAEEDQDADTWDISDGLLAGAIQYWLFSHQPCGDPRCEDCAPVCTAEGRVADLMQLVKQLAEESEYYHSPNDLNAGQA